MPTPDQAGQYRHFANRLMRGMTVQRERALANGEYAAHDADMYARLLADYASLVYQAAGLRTAHPGSLSPDLVACSDDLEQSFPRLRRFRNFLGHPPFAEFEADEETWFSFNDGPVAMLSDGRAEPIVDIELDHARVESIHAEVIAILDEVIGPRSAS